MFYVSEIKTAVPGKCTTLLQEKIYQTLLQLRIPFQRVETDEAITMADCVAIDEKLNMEMVKTLFLCNRQQTDFYLFVTKGNKPFSSKDFSHALGISRVSFAPADKLLSMLQTPIGAATVLSVIADADQTVRVVLDEEVTTSEFYGCSDGTTTGYLKIETQLIVHQYLTSAHHQPTIISL